MRAVGFALALLTAGAPTAHADVLLLNAIDAVPANSESGLMRPHRGSSMSEVYGAYGEPGSVKEAIGEPPITRWVYPGYTVYFEHDHVINVVVHR